MIITELAVLIARLLDLGLKLYPSKMQRKLKNLLDSCRVFLEYAKIEQVKERLCWQGDAMITN